jgi:hypothetical protein
MAPPEFAVAVVLGLFVVQIMANLRSHPRSSKQETLDSSQ